MVGRPHARVRRRIGRPGDQHHRVDAVDPQLPPQTLGEHLVVGLARRIPGDPAGAGEPRHRSEQDDAAPTAPAHQAAEVVAQGGGRHHVEVHQVHDLIEGAVVELHRHRVGAGVVHDQPDLEIGRRIGEPLRRVGRGEVLGDDPDLGPRGGGADLGPERVEQLAAARHEHDPETGRGQSMGEGRADAFGGAATRAQGP